MYTDWQMRDQYPSVGILHARNEAGASRVIYRVLTSWFDRAIFRDYEARVSTTGNEPIVRPRGDPVVVCSKYQVSIPILAPDGRELAGRDEAAATTKVFRLGDNGDCTELLDLRLQTGKVAWNSDGRRIAFTIPEGAVQDGSEEREDPWELKGIFVLDRADGWLTRVRGSEEVNRLTFPEFVGRDSIIFLISTDSQDKDTQNSRFRLVCCIE